VAKYQFKNYEESFKILGSLSPKCSVEKQFPNTLSHVSSKQIPQVSDPVVFKKVWCFKTVPPPTKHFEVKIIPPFPVFVFEKRTPLLRRP